MILQFKKLSPLAINPNKAYPTDSGFDLYSIEETYLEPGTTALISTGIAVKLPEGYEAVIRPRSGISAKTGLVVMLGTIDQSYLGELKIIVKNVGTAKEKIPMGYKLAQLVPQKRESVFLCEVDDFNASTDRGSSGFGSSGV